jgi:hypothetical protein
MSRVGLIILLAAVALSLAITLLSHGRFIFIGLPLLVGLPLAGAFGRRPRVVTPGRTRSPPSP